MICETGSQPLFRPFHLPKRSWMGPGSPSGATNWGQSPRLPGDKQSIDTDWIVLYPAVAAVGLRTKKRSGMQTKAVAAKK